MPSIKSFTGGYYEWTIRPKSKRELENEQILKCARKSHKESKGIYGLDKMLEDVRKRFRNAVGTGFTGYRDRTGYTL